MRRILISLAVVVLAAFVPGHPPAAASGSDRSGSIRTTLSYGPIPVSPATAQGPGYGGGFLPATPMPCTHCYVTGVEIDLVYADGRTANLDTGVMLHHMVVFNSGRPDATCGPDTGVGSLGERFFAAGNERTGGTMPAGFGYHLGHDPVRSLVEIMNHAAEPKTVFLETTVTHVPDSEPGMHPVRPVWIDQNNCASSQYSAPAGPSHQVARWTSTLTGRVIAAGGHVHDGGLRTALSNETSGQHLCTSHAGYGTDPSYAGSVESMTTCIWDRLGTVRAGEVLALDTYYDLNEPRDDVMGIMLAYVYETDDLAGGTPAPTPVTDNPPSSGSPPRGGHAHPH